MGCIMGNVEVASVKIDVFVPETIFRRLDATYGIFHELNSLSLARLMKSLTLPNLAEHEVGHRKMQIIGSIMR